MLVVYDQLWFRNDIDRLKKEMILILMGLHATVASDINAMAIFFKRTFSDHFLSNMKGDYVEDMHHHPLLYYSCIPADILDPLLLPSSCCSDYYWSLAVEQAPISHIDTLCSSSPADHPRAT